MLAHGRTVTETDPDNVLLGIYGHNFYTIP